MIGLYCTCKRTNLTQRRGDAETQKERQFILHFSLSHLDSPLDLAFLVHFDAHNFGQRLAFDLDVPATVGLLFGGDFERRVGRIKAIEPIERVLNRGLFIHWAVSFKWYAMLQNLVGGPYHDNR